MLKETTYLHYLLSRGYLQLPVKPYETQDIPNHADLLTRYIQAGYLVEATPAEALAQLHKKDVLIDALRTMGSKLTGTKDKLAQQLVEKFPEAAQQLIGDAKVLRRTKAGSEELSRLEQVLDKLRKQALQAEWHHHYQLALRDYRRTDGIVGMQVIALEVELCPECAHLPGLYALPDAPKRIHLPRCQRSPYPCRLTHECVLDFDEEAKALNHYRPATWDAPPTIPNQPSMPSVPTKPFPEPLTTTQHVNQPVGAYQSAPPSPYAPPRTEPGLLGNPVIRLCLYVLAIPMIVIMLAALFG